MSPVVGAAVDIMVSDFDGNAEDDLINKKVIYMNLPIAAVTSCEYLKAVVNNMVTGYTSASGKRDDLLWQACIHKDNHFTSKRQPQAIPLEQDHMFNGRVISHMDR